MMVVWQIIFASTDAMTPANTPGMRRSGVLAVICVGDGVGGLADHRSRLSLLGNATTDARHAACSRSPAKSAPHASQ